MNPRIGRSLTINVTNESVVCLRFYILISQPEFNLTFPSFHNPRPTRKWWWTSSTVGTSWPKTLTYRVWIANTTAKWFWSQRTRYMNHWIDWRISWIDGAWTMNILRYALARNWCENWCKSKSMSGVHALVYFENDFTLSIYWKMVELFWNENMPISSRFLFYIDNKANKGYLVDSFFSCLIKYK